MKIPFWKMHGAGNDFILVDDRAGRFPVDDRAWIAGISTRRTGVGCDGVILIQPPTHADFRMRFFNPDGGEAEMCGNGARCVARLAYELGVTAERMTLETPAGDVGAFVLPDRRVRLSMTPPLDLQLDAKLSLSDGQELDYDSVNTGVPHVVVRVPDLDGVDVAGLGRRVREHPHFAPAGTNVDFVVVDSDGAVSIRTYERGVEAETLACGTGVTAAALTMACRGDVQPPVTVRTVLGYELEVDYRGDEPSMHDVTLSGPADHVCEGILRYG